MAKDRNTFFGVKRPLPGFGKLAFENKILLFIIAIIVAAGSAIFIVSFNVQVKDLSNLYSRQIQYEGRAIQQSLTSAIRANDTAALPRLLRTTAARDSRIAYQIVHVEDTGGIYAFPKGDKTPGWLIDAGFDFQENEQNSLINEQEHFVESVIYLTHDNQRLGTLRIGYSQSDIVAFIRSSTLTAASLVFIPIVIILFFSRYLIRYAVRPLKDLIKVTDRIAAGDLDIPVEFGAKVRCWEIKDCDQTDCKAYMNNSLQCWYVDGTPCEGYEPNFPEKLIGCRTCQVYLAHKGDEVTQLADAFGHMTLSLKNYRDDFISSIQYQRSLINNSFDGIVATDSKGLITFFNKAAQEVSGYTRAEMRGTTGWEMLFEKRLINLMDQPFTYGTERRLRGFAPTESTLTRKDGGVVDVRLSGISLYERGILMGKVFTFQDMRELKKLQADLLASERLAATGQAAASISHAIKNILGGFQGGVYVYKRGVRLDDQKEIDTGWDMVERNVKIISDLVKDLLNFSKARTPTLEKLKLSELLEDVVRNAGESSNGNMEFKYDIEKSADEIYADYHSFHQCLANLVKNAVEAIEILGLEEKGIVRLSAKIQGDHTLITVSDNGPGMNPETVEKVGTGMYSTKGSKGTGLGLMVVRKIVEEHKGALSIESKMGKGTSFKILLPRSSEPVQD